MQQACGPDRRGEETKLQPRAQRRERKQRLRTTTKRTVPLRSMWLQPTPKLQQRRMRVQRLHG